MSVKMEEKMNIELLSDICRLCLQNGEFQSIFHTENEMHFAQKVMFCTSVEISPEDHLPSLICHPCILNLNTAYDFKKLCEQSDITLRSQFVLDNHDNHGSIKDEKKLWVDVDIKLEDGDRFSGDGFSKSDIEENSSVNSDKIPLSKRKKSVKKQKSDEIKVKHNSKLEPKIKDKSNATKNESSDGLLVTSKSRIEKNVLKTKKIRKKGVKTTGGQKYQCFDCPRVFSFQCALTIHRRRHTGERPWECSDCSKTFVSTSELNRHRASLHTRLMQYSCPVCGRHFNLSSGLRTHMRTHTGEKPYQCTECGARFSQPGSLRTHKRRHSGEHPFVCDVCGSAFTSHGGLARHKRTHTGERRAQCNVCGKKFVSVSYLPEHMRLHTGEKPFKCKECGKCFSLASNLAIHARTHAAEGEHVCPECGKPCTDLKVHMRTHTGDRPYTCPFCDKRFKQCGNLKYHITTHTNERKFDCQVCNKKFKTNDALKEHSTMHTGERPHKCELCTLTFRGGSAKRKHIKKCHSNHSTPTEPAKLSKRFTKKDKSDGLNLQSLIAKAGICEDDKDVI